MSFTAGTVINAVRDLIPDPSYDANGNPLPDANGGLFRAASLYRWLDTLVRRAARLSGAIIVDWTALQLVATQPWYALDDRFLTISDAFSNQFAIDTITLTEGDVIWPSTSAAASQSLWGYLRRGGNHLEFGLWPVPSVADPATTLVGGITAGAPDPIVLASTAGFLSYGYVKIGTEIIQYQKLVTGPAGIGVLSRGACGTTAAVHNNNDAVTHLGLWCKGARTPALISASTSVIELPPDIIDLLEDALLARCRSSEQEFSEGSRLLQAFDTACKEVRADPMRKENQGQIRAYGDERVGPLYGGGWGRILR
jgi:hypothetical protein